MTAPNVSHHELTKEEEIWKRYNAISRTLTPEFIANIPWERLGPCPSDDFARALMIASDVETATYDVFFLQQLADTPSSRDPVIAAFMRRWVSEELTHGELLREVLRRWGFAYRYEPPRFSAWYRMGDRMLHAFNNVLGSRFKAIHMIWGGINELTARETYRQLKNQTADPVINMLLGAIIKEESMHANFYLNIGKAKLDARFATSLCRVLLRYWRPVGGWNKSNTELKPVFGLFSGERLYDFERYVTQEFERRIPALRNSGLTDILSRLVKLATA